MHNIPEQLSEGSLGQIVSVDLGIMHIIRIRTDSLNRSQIYRLGTEAAKMGM